MYQGDNHDRRTKPWILIKAKNCYRQLKTKFFNGEDDDWPPESGFWLGQWNNFYESFETKDQQKKLKKLPESKQWDSHFFVRVYTSETKGPNPKKKRKKHPEMNSMKENGFRFIEPEYIEALKSAIASSSNDSMPTMHLQTIKEQEIDRPGTRVCGVGSVCMRALKPRGKSTSSDSLEVISLKQQLAVQSQELAVQSEQMDAMIKYLQQMPDFSAFQVSTTASTTSNPV